MTFLLPYNELFSLKCKITPKSRLLDFTRYSVYYSRANTILVWYRCTPPLRNNCRAIFIASASGRLPQLEMYRSEKPSWCKYIFQFWFLRMQWQQKWSDSPLNVVAHSFHQGGRDVNNPEEPSPSEGRGDHLNLQMLRMGFTPGVPQTATLLWSLNPTLNFPTIRRITGLLQYEGRSNRRRSNVYPYQTDFSRCQIVWKACLPHG